MTLVRIYVWHWWLITSDTGVRYKLKRHTEEVIIQVCETAPDKAGQWRLPACILSEEKDKTR